MFFFFNDTATTEIYTLSLHDALPILGGGTLGQIAEARLGRQWLGGDVVPTDGGFARGGRDEARQHAHRGGLAGPVGAERSGEHTSELQSPCNLVCRLLLEKKKQKPSP